MQGPVCLYCMRYFAFLRRIRFRDLRHTTASILINQGAPPKSIQRQMRHASIETTFDTYLDSAQGGCGWLKDPRLNWNR